MTDLTAQKRLAADILDVGENKVWFDPERQSDLADAITRDDVREMIDEGAIQAKDAQGNSRGQARARQEKRAYGHQKGAGSRKGKAGARQNEKKDWSSRIRAQRNWLKEQRDDGQLDSSQYRDLYDQAAGGEFDSVADLQRYVEANYGDE
ncbi:MULTISPECIES: 50S ribosomal protein L19e [Halomicrobium]|uniref:Large ribosomal subunit protein eL19 n=2 Tax=Halomicrobium mukohataei TaxID=57705 RepID=C7P4D8_HALMD|nr:MULTISPECIES: 50S ribosomal protein L19e [Halomicrobium]ACV47960.1 Ribosomal protein L19e [Halomicrobium mukohataei DSM 12286]QCD66397.1 50S ribosomal protein L19e [Halomicrobium mukohataei]QFR21202.1 50S ribosomal protein L19e [Halomicrobium sp. ZPS1]